MNVVDLFHIITMSGNHYTNYEAAWFSLATLYVLIDWKTDTCKINAYIVHSTLFNKYNIDGTYTDVYSTVNPYTGIVIFIPYHKLT